MGQILGFLRKPIGQAGKTEHSHARGEVFPLDKGSREVLRIGIAKNYSLFTAYIFCGAIPISTFCSWKTIVLAISFFV